MTTGSGSAFETVAEAYNRNADKYDEFIENNPDTTMTLLSGKRMVVRESYQTVYDRIVAYRRLVGAFKNEE